MENAISLNLFSPAAFHWLSMRFVEQEALLAAIDALPPAQRGAILLHYLEDFSLAEIAGITDASVGTVKSRLHYGKAALRQRLSDLAPRP